MIFSALAALPIKRLNRCPVAASMPGRQKTASSTLNPPAQFDQGRIVQQRLTTQDYPAPLRLALRKIRKISRSGAQGLGFILRQACLPQAKPGF